MSCNDFSPLQGQPIFIYQCKLFVAQDVNHGWIELTYIMMFNEFHAYHLQWRWYAWNSLNIFIWNVETLKKHMLWNITVSIFTLSAFANFKKIISYYGIKLFIYHDNIACNISCTSMLFDLKQIHITQLDHVLSYNHDQIRQHNEPCA